MHTDRTALTLARLNRRTSGLALLLAGSVAANALLGVAVLTARQTILVPMLPTEATLTTFGAVSADYLEAVARDACYLFLNRTPDNQVYFEQQLLKIADASTYQAIRASLQDMRRGVTEGHVSQSFAPSEWYVDPPHLYVEAAGTLITTNGVQPPLSEQKIYALRFIRRGAAVRLRSFYEIKAADSASQKVRVTPPPAPPTTPPSIELAPPPPTGVR